MYVDGKYAMRLLMHSLKQLCEDFLGVLTPDIKGQRLSLPWLVELFTELLLDVNINVVCI